MKVTILFTLVLISSGLYVVNYPEAFGNVVKSVAASTDSFINDQDLRYQGLEMLTADDVEGMLPQDKSSFWWRLHLSTVEASLAQHPLIEGVSVRPCGVMPLGCFDIEVIEREHVEHFPV